MRKIGVFASMESAHSIEQDIWEDVNQVYVYYEQPI